jgi:hypothetical protein
LNAHFAFFYCYYFAFWTSFSMFCSSILCSYFSFSLSDDTEPFSKSTTLLTPVFAYSIISFTSLLIGWFCLLSTILETEIYCLSNFSSLFFFYFALGEISFGSYEILGYEILGYCFYWLWLLCSALLYCCYYFWLFSSFGTFWVSFLSNIFLREYDYIFFYDPRLSTFSYKLYSALGCSL